jgi:hypothetical protein
MRVCAVRTFNGHFLNSLNLVKFYYCKRKSTGRGSLIKQKKTQILTTIMFLTVQVFF